MVDSFRIRGSKGETGLKRTFSMLGSEVKLPMLGSDALADIGLDLGGGSPVCMTPQATPDSPRKAKISTTPPSPPNKRNQRELGHRVSWSDLLGASQGSDGPGPLEKALRGLDSGPSRFLEEFKDAKVIGKGNFSVVYRAQHKIDGCVYAVKKTKGTVKTCRSEAQFLAALSSCGAASSEHIVRYYGCWIEDGRLHIQTELCDFSLSHIVREKNPRVFGNSELIELMQHVGQGLDALHSHDTVHLDIKPDNILKKGNVFKIADLGLAVLAIQSNCREVTEGDCRYLAREILKSELRDLTKADVFSFGIMTYELATGEELPHDGTAWNYLRDGVPPESIPVAHAALAELIAQMMDPLPDKRPPCSELLYHELLASERRQLETELEAARAEAEKYRAELALMEKKMTKPGAFRSKEDIFTRTALERHVTY
jgi:wee1-like protein kinase